MERKLDVGEALSEVFAIYRRQAGVLLPIAFWLFLAVAIVEELTRDEVSLFWIGIVVALAVGTLYQGTVVGLVRDVQDGRRDSSAGELTRATLPVLGPLIGASILAGLGIGIGLVLLLVPGLYLLTIWSVIAPVIVVERSGSIAAFGRSRELVRGNGWPVFWTVFAAFLIATVAAIAFFLIATSIADGPLIEIVLSVLALTLTAPIEGLVASVLYFRLREIEGEPPGSVPQQPGDRLG